MNKTEKKNEYSNIVLIFSWENVYDLFFFYDRRYVFKFFTVANAAVAAH